MYVVTSAGSVLGLVALLVAAVAIAYSALTRTTIATLKESNAAYAERITNLENDREADRTQIATLTSERDTLARVVTGEAHLVAIEQLVTQHNTDAHTWWTAAAVDLRGIREALEGSSS